MNQPKPSREGLLHGSTEMELLTQREREICHLVALGHTNLAIADRLEISPKTVETHRSNIMAKLGLRSRAELVRFALEHGLIRHRPAGGFFKRCATCRIGWALRGEFLSDPALRFSGYQTAAGNRSAGFLFEHHLCGTTLTLPLESFQELTGQPLLAESCLSTANREHCLASDTVASCPLRCVCNFVWQTCEIVRCWPKNKAVAG